MHDESTYPAATAAATAAAKAHHRRATSYHLGDVCYGVGIPLTNDRWAVLAADPDHPDDWAYAVGTNDDIIGGIEWTPTPAAWGTSPKQVGAGFARAFRSR